MTIFGPDLSSYQDGLDLSRLTSASFVIAKTTEGTYYTDSGYQGWRRQAAALGKPFVWYHFLSGEDPHAQVAHTAANVGDAGLPGMLDVEPTGNFSPTLAQVLAYTDAARQAGLRLRLVYLPRWYWQELGSPDLTPLADRGLELVASAYPGGTGSPTRLYPGDSAAGWQPYGGMTPLLYQYTNQASDGGQALDYNAYRGTLEQLLADLGHPTPDPSTGDTSMGDIALSGGYRAEWPDLGDYLAPKFPPGQKVSVEVDAEWANFGARAAAEYARQARDEIRALAERYTAPPPVDVNALAAALAPLLAAGADAQTIAHAVVVELGAVLKAGAPQ